MSDPYIGEIRAFSITYVPYGWLECNGQLLPISQNQALFAVIGNNFGGTYPNTFALPNLNGVTFVGKGPNHSFANTGGAESVTLQNNQYTHSHPLNFTAQLKCANVTGDKTTVAGNSIAVTNGLTTASYSNQTPDKTMLAGAVSVSGTLQPNPLSTTNPTPHNNMQPYLTLIYCIAPEGVFPVRQ